LLLTSRFESWLAANRAPLVVACLAMTITLINDLLHYPVEKAAAAHQAVSSQAPEIVQPDLHGWALSVMAVLLFGGAAACLAAALCWFAVPEARAWLQPKLRRAAPRPWPALRILDLIAVFLVCVSTLSVLALNILAKLEPNSGAHMAWNMLVNEAALCLALSVAISLARHRAQGFQGSDGLWPFWRLAEGNRPRGLWQDIALGAAAYPLMLWAMQLSVRLNQELVRSAGGKLDEHQLIQVLGKAQPGWVVAVSLVMGTVGAAFFEELLFRGVLYNVLRRYMGATASACLAALIFAASHGIWSQVLGLFFLGLVLTWLYDHTGRLVASMTLHATNNLVSLILVLYSQ
jgi:membrane protease YdiL (CAAX protease family)